MRRKVIPALVAALTLGGCGRENILPPVATAPGGIGAMGTGGVGAGAPGGAGVMGTGGVGGASATPSFDPVDAIDRVTQVLSNKPGATAPADLRQQAVAGALNTKEALAGAVRQLLATGLVEPGVTAFYRWWLGLDDVGAAGWLPDASLYPEATPDLLNAMVEETTTFGVQVTLVLGGTFQTLMTAPFSFLNVPLASLYGVSRAPVGGTGWFEQTDLPAGVRAGLLTQPALQVVSSSSIRPAPTHRGSLTAQQILCEPSFASPPSLTSIDPIPAGTTTRQALTADLGGAPVCTPCHDFLDPIGFAFGGFDVIGRVRTTDNGGSVDTSNLKVIVPEPDGTLSTTVVNGPVELATLFATDPVAERCYLTKWLAFALGGAAADDFPALDESAFAAFAASGFNLKEGIVAVLSSDAFLTPAPP